MKKRMIALLMLILLVIGCTAAMAEDLVSPYEPIVRTTGGDVLGYKLDGTYRFLGIPYATAERFGMPQEATWQGTLYALTYGTVCPIADDGSVNFTEFITPSAVVNQIKNENCQNLNIWTQTLDTEAKKPVMVWIHGGGFSSGSSTELAYYDGDNLSANGDVVVVSLNHRLNVLGFLDLSEYGDEYKYSGNAGMADIIAALEWIQKNIAQFGGDPNNVTIIGQSGGGAKVATLMGMPAAQGLFHKAIEESGSLAGTDQTTARKVASLTMEALGCKTVEELKAVDYDDLIKAANTVIAEVNAEDANWSWGPVIDGDYYPTCTVTDGKFSELSKDVTLMAATTLGEFSGNSVFLSKGYPGEYYVPDITEERVMEKLTEKYGEKAQDVADAFLAAYPDHALADVLFTDTAFYADSDEIMLPKVAQSAEGGAPVYRYVFAWNYKCFGGTTPSHCAEIPFFMHNVDEIPHLTLGSEDAYALEDIVCKAYANFAYTGDPSQEGYAWDPYTVEDPSIMVFDITSAERGAEVSKLMELMGTMDINATKDAY